MVQLRIQIIATIIAKHSISLVYSIYRLEKNDLEPSSVSLLLVPAVNVRLTSCKVLHAASSQASGGLGKVYQDNSPHVVLYTVLSK